jgi:hypothetical protein
LTILPVAKPGCVAPWPISSSGVKAMRSVGRGSSGWAAEIVTAVAHDRLDARPRLVRSASWADPTIRLVSTGHCPAGC